MHMAQLMPLPLTVSCFSKSRLVYLSGTGSPGQSRKRAVKRFTYLLTLLTYVCVCFDTVSWTSASEVMTLWRYTHTFIIIIIIITKPVGS